MAMRLDHTANKASAYIVDGISYSKRGMIHASYFKRYLNDLDVEFVEMDLMLS
jgi:hypothetical protein